MTHTPTPWIHVKGNLIRDSHGVCIAGDSTAIQNAANAAHIVHCVNSHDALVEALRVAQEYIGRMEGKLSQPTHYAYQAVTEALALAEGTA